MQWKELEQNAGQNVCRVSRSPWRNASSRPDTLSSTRSQGSVSPLCHVGGLIRDKSDVFISGPGTPRLRYPFQVEDYLPGVRKANSTGYERFSGGVLYWFIGLFKKKNVVSSNKKNACLLFGA